MIAHFDNPPAPARYFRSTLSGLEFKIDAAGFGFVRSPGTEWIPSHVTLQSVAACAVEITAEEVAP
jgi:hypothetical protein